MQNTYFDKLLWIDTEFSSLKLEEAALMEVAMIITDSNFDAIEEIDFVIHTHEVEIEKMKSALIAHNPDKPELDRFTNTYDLHESSGLIDLVEKSTNTMKQVEGELIKFVDKHFPDSKPILAGNSIDFDRTILKHNMPELFSKFHYRVIDVSSFKLVILNDGKPAFEKLAKHRAIEDIRESIEELRYLLELAKGQAN